MSSSLSHASSMPFLVSVERAKLHARFKMWANHGFMQVHNGILCFVFQFISQEFLPCSLLCWWLLNAKVTFSWVCLSYPKGITLEWHWSVQSLSFYMWRWRFFRHVALYLPRWKFTCHLFAQSLLLENPSTVLHSQLSSFPPSILILSALHSFKSIYRVWSF